MIITLNGGTQMPTEKQKEKETKKIVSEDVEKFFRDVWGKVVEYASLGAEEATKLSSTAKTRVDAETLKFKRGKVIKMLGERYLDLCEKDPSLIIPGTKEILRDIKGINNEIQALEKELVQEKKTAKKEPAKKGAPKKAAPKKAPVKRKVPTKKAAPKKVAPKKTPAPKPPEESK
jgi:hypothetical protein